MNKMILLVFSHPDDESFGVAGIAAKYSHEGIPVDLICATRGEKGTRLDVPDNVSTGVAREAELKDAAAVIGIRNIYFLGYIDGEVKKVTRIEIQDKILKIMRKLDPEVVITFGPDGITGHPDHIAIGKAATHAFKSLYHQNKSRRKLYYVTLVRSNFRDSRLATRPDNQVISFDIGEYFETKIKAIEMHRSQQDARDFLEELESSEISNDMKKEYLYLARPQIKFNTPDLFISV
jgi:LmbE family N-acetylglucosaminyl deacetylase